MNFPAVECNVEWRRGQGEGVPYQPLSRKPHRPPPDACGLG